MAQRIDLVVNAETQDLQKMTKEMQAFSNAASNAKAVTESINMVGNNANNQQNNLIQQQANNSNSNLEKAISKETETTLKSNDLLKELVNAVKEATGAISDKSTTSNGLVQASQAGAGNQAKKDNSELAEYKKFSSATRDVVSSSSNAINKMGNGVSATNQIIGDALTSGAGVVAATGNLAIAGGLLAAGLVSKATDSFKKLYTDKIPSLLELQGAYGTGTNKADNTAQMDSRWDRFTTTVQKDATGFNLDDYIKTQLELATYGFSDVGATDSTSRILKMQAATNANRNTLIGFEGINEKFGNNTATALNEAYSGLVNSGMQKGQFNEFLQGLQSVMEEGISKGFVRSAKDIASDMALISVLSNNNPLWQGKEGAEKIQTVSNSLESATSLNSVSDVLLYRSFYDSIDNDPNYESKTGSKMIDTFMLMEQGLTKESLPLIQNSMNNLSTYEEKIEMLKGFGFNYTGASQLYDIINGIDGKVSDKTMESVNKLVDNPDFKSDLQDYSSALVNLETKLTELSETTSSIERAVIAGLFGTKDSKEGEELVASIMGAETDINTGALTNRLTFGNVAMGRTMQVNSSAMEDDSMAGWYENLNEEYWNIYMPKLGAKGKDWFNSEIQTGLLSARNSEELAKETNELLRQILIATGVKPKDDSAVYRLMDNATWASVFGSDQ